LRAKPQEHAKLTLKKGKAWFFSLKNKIDSKTCFNWSRLWLQMSCLNFSTNSHLTQTLKCKGHFLSEDCGSSKKTKHFQASNFFEVIINLVKSFLSITNKTHVGRFWIWFWGHKLNEKSSSCIKMFDLFEEPLSSYKKWPLTEFGQDICFDGCFYMKQSLTTSTIMNAVP